MTPTISSLKRSLTISRVKGEDKWLFWKLKTLKKEHIKTLIIRAISDTIDDNDYMDFEKFKVVAAEETLKVIKAFFY